MIDRQDKGSAVGTALLGSSDRLFHRWHKYRDGEMAWSTFLGYARPIRWGVRQALGRGVSCAPHCWYPILGSICSDTTALTSEARRGRSSRDERPAPTVRLAARRRDQERRASARGRVERPTSTSKSRHMARVTK